MNVYHFHIGDYRRKTAHLSHEEHYVYRWLIDEYFLTETPLSTNLHMLSRKLGLTSDQKPLLQQLLEEFFVLEGDGWYHKHVEQVMARVHAKSAQSKAAINKRWEMERELRKANGKDTPVLRPYYGKNTDVIPNQEPITNNQDKKTQCLFDTFWLAYPKDRRRDKKKALATWKRRHLDKQGEQIIADVKNRVENDDQWKRGFSPMPTTYLNGDRWEDELGGEDNEPSDFGKGGI